MELSAEDLEEIRDKLISINPKDVEDTVAALAGIGDVIRAIPDVFAFVLSLSEEATRHKEALNLIATGEGAHSTQALEYKNIARRALGMPDVGRES